MQTLPSWVICNEDGGRFLHAKTFQSLGCRVQGMLKSTNHMKRLDRSQIEILNPFSFCTSYHVFAMYVSHFQGICFSFSIKLHLSIDFCDIWSSKLSCIQQKVQRNNNKGRKHIPHHIFIISIMTTFFANQKSLAKAIPWFNHNMYF